MSDTPASPRLHTFFTVKEPGAPDRVLVFDTQEVSVGRAKENDLQAKYSDVSRRHALLVRDGKQCSVQSLSTSGQTLVNGDAVKVQTLKNGDVIRISEIELTFSETADNPASLGLKLEYASQLKEFEGPSIQGDNAEATILGIADAGDDDGTDTFKVRPPGDFDLHGLEAEMTAPRDLDAELDGFGIDDLHMPDPNVSPLPLEPSSAVDSDQLPPVLQPAPAAPSAAADDAGVWKLEESAAVPAKSEPTLSLQLEIDGLSDELRAVFGNLLGKDLSLPPLRIRIKGDDLG